MATALVTGATAGIGAAYAKLLAKEGFDLVLVARDLPRLKGVAKELSKLYKIKTETIKADLTKPAQLAKVEKRLANNLKPIEVQASMLLAQFDKLSEIKKIRQKNH